MTSPGISQKMQKINIRAFAGVALGSKGKWKRSDASAISWQQN